MHQETSDDSATTRTSRTTRLGRVLFLVIGLLLVLVVLQSARYHIIDRDESQAAELAQSVSDAFCYCTSAIPKLIYPVDQSTNGPLVYVAAFFFAISHSNPDVALVGVSGLGTLLIVSALFALEPWLIIVAALLYFGWPTVHILSTTFFGEMWAIGFSLWGIVFFRRLDLRRGFPRSLKNRDFLFACICFGFAMESKLISTASIVTVVFALSYQNVDSSSVRKIVLNLSRAVLVCALTTTGAFVVLFVSIAISVAHSTHNLLDVHAMFQTPLGFLSNMVLQGTTKSDPDFLGHFGIRVHHFSRPMLLVFPLVAAVALTFRNWAYLPFLAVSLVAWLKVGDNEDHIAIAFYLVIILGALESHALIRRFVAGSQRRMITQCTAAAMALIVFFNIVPQAQIAAEISTAPIPSFDSRRYVATATGMYHYSAKLVEMIRQQPYVATSGFWYFPEMVVREHHLHFYDRTALSTTLLPKDKVALLIDSGNGAAPPTSVKDNCGRIIYQDGPIVLCHIRSDRLSDFGLHTVPNVKMPTTGPNLLVNPSFAVGYTATATTTGTMRANFDKAGDSVRVSLNNAIGATQLYHGVRVMPGEMVVVSGILTVSGASLPRFAGTDVYYLDGADGPKAGEGVDSSNDPGKYPFAFTVTPLHSNGQIMFFIHIETASNDKTTIGLRNLAVTAVKKAR